MGSGNDRKKVILFYNPNAGNGLFKNNLDLIIERFQQKKLMVIPIRAGRGDVLDGLFRTIDPAEYRQVIAAGGDGTINICVNAMIRNNIDLPLANSQRFCLLSGSSPGNQQHDRYCPGKQFYLQRFGQGQR